MILYFLYVVIHPTTAKTMHILTILGFTYAEGCDFVLNDPWYAINKDNDEVQRYVNYEFDHTGDNVAVVVTSKTPKEGYVRVNKVVNSDAIEFEQILFSVNGNKGPALAVKNFFANDGMVHGDCETIFLGHVAWLCGTGGYGIDSDLLCQYEADFMRKSADFDVDFEKFIPDIATGCEIFNTELYAAFIKVRIAMETAEFSSSHREQLINGMKQDMLLVQRFMPAI